MLINGEAKNITDLAAKLGLKPPYVTRVLGLNNLAPDIAEAIVNGADIHRTNHEKHFGRLERTAEAFRFPGTVIAGNAWRQEKSCRLFCFAGCI